MTSQYLSELGYTYQVQRRCDRASASYADAASAAERASDESTKTFDLTRAWRGQAYCLVEQGRLDDAERLYNKCLALDPSDAKAKAELQYLKSKREKGASSLARPPIFSGLLALARRGRGEGAIA